MSHADWPRYQSHKIVHAAEISEVVEAQGEIIIWVKPFGDDRVETFKPSMPSMAAAAVTGGYAVVYDDGFRSISPKKAFEDGYYPLPGIGGAPK